MTVGDTWLIPLEAAVIVPSGGLSRNCVGSLKERGRKLLKSFQRDAPTATFSSVNESPERGIAKELEDGDDNLVVGSYWPAFC